jgi:hypothetical protein
LIAAPPRLGVGLIDATQRFGRCCTLLLMALPHQQCLRRYPKLALSGVKRFADLVALRLLVSVERRPAALGISADVEVGQIVIVVIAENLDQLATDLAAVPLCAELALAVVAATAVRVRVVIPYASGAINMNMNLITASSRCLIADHRLALLCLCGVAASEPRPVALFRCSIRGWRCARKRGMAPVMIGDHLGGLAVFQNSQPNRCAIDCPDACKRRVASSSVIAVIPLGLRAPRRQQ